MKPFFSVIIPTYNCKEMVLDCLESIRGQTYAPIEIIVVDSFSTDGTLELAAQVGAGPKIKSLRINRIAADELVENLAEQSATDLDWPFLVRLRDSGRLAADNWLAKEPAGSD